MGNWTAIVVDPFRSLAKQKPDFGCFRVFPPSFDSNPNVQPDGTPVIDKESTLARWGPVYNRYYALAPTFFMSGLSKRFVDIMSANNLWIRTLSSTPLMEPETRERFSERVKKATDQLEAGSRREAFGGGGGPRMRGGHMGGPGPGGPVGGGQGGGSNKAEQGAKAVEELALELSSGQVNQVTKEILFNEAFTQKDNNKAKAIPGK